MSENKIAIIDYGMGNLWSVLSALKYLGAEAEIVSDASRLDEFSQMILPGVGSFRLAMEAVKKNGFDKAIYRAVKERNAKILGICLGMQLLGTRSSEDGETIGLGLVDIDVEPFDEEEVRGQKIPHVGFNPVYFSDRQGFFADLSDRADFYFVHSYRMLPNGVNGRVAICNYGIEFLAAFEIGNIYGAQFHPEKSQTNGLIMLKNFVSKETTC